mgnify:CR=1 FL=1
MKAYLNISENTKLKKKLIKLQFIFVLFFCCVNQFYYDFIFGLLKFLVVTNLFSKNNITYHQLKGQMAERSKAADSRSAGATRASSNLAQFIVFINFC